jgi:hypothetical protein
MDTIVKSETKYLKNINNIYNKADYFKRYGGDVYLTIIIIITMICFIVYFSILNNLQKVRADWENQKCNPFYMPFVNIINPNPNKTTTEQISDNFHDCIVEGIKESTTSATNSFYSQLNRFTDVKHAFFGSMNFISALFKTLFNAISEIIARILTFINKFIFGFSNIFIKFKSILEKVLGVVATTFFMFLELFYLSMAWFLNIATFTTVTTITPLVLTLAGQMFLGLIMSIIGVIFAGLQPIPFVGQIVFTPLTVAILAIDVTLIIAAIVTLILLICATVVCIAMIIVQDAVHRKINKSSSVSSKH